MLRHKDLLLCGVGALAFHLMQMFDIEVRQHPTFCALSLYTCLDSPRRSQNKALPDLEARGPDGQRLWYALLEIPRSARSRYAAADSFSQRPRALCRLRRATLYLYCCMRLSQRDKQAVDNFLAGGCAVTYGSEVVGRKCLVWWERDGAEEEDGGWFVATIDRYVKSRGHRLLYEEEDGCKEEWADLSTLKIRWTDEEAGAASGARGAPRPSASRAVAGELVRRLPASAPQAAAQARRRRTGRERRRTGRKNPVRGSCRPFCLGVQAAG